MNFVIVGANGFFGSKLCNYLIEFGHDVTAVFNKKISNINSNIKRVQIHDIQKINIIIIYIIIR